MSSSPNNGKESEMIVALPEFLTDYQEKAFRLLEDLTDAATEVAVCFESRELAGQRLRDAEANLEAQLNAEIVATDYLATQMKEGPLAGVARTSDAYKSIVAKLRYDAVHDGVLSFEQENVDRLRQDYLQAGIDLEQAKTKFTALKVSANLLEALLRTLGH